MNSYSSCNYIILHTIMPIIFTQQSAKYTHTPKLLFQKRSVSNKVVNFALLVDNNKRKNGSRKKSTLVCLLVLLHVHDYDEPSLLQTTKQQHNLFSELFLDIYFINNNFHVELLCVLYSYKLKMYFKRHVWTFKVHSIVKNKILIHLFYECSLEQKKETERVFLLPGIYFLLHSPPLHVLLLNFAGWDCIQEIYEKFIVHILLFLCPILYIWSPLFIFIFYTFFCTFVSCEMWLLQMYVHTVQ